jgi:acetylornithine/N-succinyldiaminopimelate aminotransferase
MASTIEPGVMPTYARADEVFVDGIGAIVRDQNGREFIDFLSGIAVNALGHKHPRLTAELADQIAKVVHLSNLFRHPFTESVAERLCEYTGMAQVFFTNSGSESIECAMKVARKAMHIKGSPQRTSFLALEGAFHGRTLGALSLTHNQQYRSPFAPLLDTQWVKPGDIDLLTQAIRLQQPAALFLEPIQGEGGIRELSRDYLHAARELCTETGTLLVHDEIQSGCGRTGKFLAAQHCQVTPDVVTLAKPIGAGLPMGVCLVSADFQDTLTKGEHGSTFGGGPLACRAASVFLDELDNGLLDQVTARGLQLRAGLNKIAAEVDMVKEVRGRGLMLGLRLNQPASTIQQALHQAGLIVNCTASDVLRIVPPFVITEQQVGEGLQLLHQTLASFQESPEPI